jgi:hypothetical protein
MKGDLDVLDVIEMAGPEWSGTWQRCKAALEGRAVPDADPGPVVAGGQMGVAESWARAVSGSNGGQIALPLTLPLALVTTSICCQGAIWVQAPLDDGDPLEVPVIIQSLAVAPSGYGKSTVLDPLVKMLLRLYRAGHGRRSGIVKGILDQGLVAVDLAAAGAKAAGQLVADEVWDAARGALGKITEKGRCGDLLVDQSTPEGVRRSLQLGGSMTGVLTAEPDILREVGAYAKDAGSLRFFLDGWGASRIGVNRAERKMVIPAAVVPFAILMQPQSFDAFNRDRTDGGSGGGVGGVAADSAVGRGFFGRSWLVRIPAAARSRTPFGMNGGGGGGSGGVGVLKPVTAAGVVFEDMAEALLMRTEDFRVRMGVFIGWEEALGGGDGREAADVVKAPGEPDKVWLSMTEAARAEYAMVQNLRTAMIDAVQRLEADGSGAETVLMPMAARWTQHVLRVAAVLTLGVDPAAVVIEDWAVRDAGQRVCVWLLEHWCREMADYREAAQAATIEQEIKFNPRGADLTPLGQVVEVLNAMAAEQMAGGAAAAPAWGRAVVLAKMRNKVRGAARDAVNKAFADAFDELVTAGALAKKTTESKAGGKGGRPKVWFEPGALAHKYGVTAF